MDYCRVFRLETRAREFVVVARLRGLILVVIGKPTCPQFSRDEVLIGPVVTAIKPEAGRSNPG